MGVMTPSGGREFDQPATAARTPSICGKERQGRGRRSPPRTSAGVGMPLLRPAIRGASSMPTDAAGPRANRLGHQDVRIRACPGSESASRSKRGESHHSGTSGLWRRPSGDPPARSGRHFRRRRWHRARPAGPGGPVARASLHRGAPSPAARVSTIASPPRRHRLGGASRCQVSNQRRHNTKPRPERTGATSRASRGDRQRKHDQRHHRRQGPLPPAVA